jgi:hypothetical protein
LPGDPCFGEAVGCGDKAVDPCLVTGAILGTSGLDFLAGTTGDDLICGFGGNDRIDGGGGNDTIYAGSGDDVVSGGDGLDFVFGEAGNDQLSGNSGEDVLVGGEGNDQLFGGAGVDSLAGSIGTDTANGGDGAPDVCTSSETEIECETPVSFMALSAGPVTASNVGAKVTVRSVGLIDATDLVIRDISLTVPFLAQDLAGVPVDISLKGPTRTFISADVEIAVASSIPLKEVDVFTQEAGAWVKVLENRVNDEARHRVSVTMRHFTPAVPVRRFVPPAVGVRSVPAAGYKCLSVGASIKVTTFIDVSGSSDGLKRGSKVGLAELIGWGPPGTDRSIVTSNGETLLFGNSTDSFPKVLREGFQSFGATDLGKGVAAAVQQALLPGRPISILNVLLADVPADQVSAVVTQIEHAATNNVLVNVFMADVAPIELKNAVSQSHGFAWDLLGSDGLLKKVRDSKSVSLDPFTDLDVDGLTDCEENLGVLAMDQNRQVSSVSGLSYAVTDTNHDGVLDGRDSDLDGVPDGVELGVSLTPDVERAAWTVGRVVHSFLSNPTELDSDLDNIPDLLEFQRETTFLGPDRHLASYEFLDENEVIALGFTRAMLIARIHNLNLYEVEKDEASLPQVDKATLSGLFGFVLERSLIVRQGTDGLDDYTPFAGLNRPSRHDKFKQNQVPYLTIMADIQFRVAIDTATAIANSAGMVLLLLASSFLTAGALVSSLRFGAGVLLWQAPGQLAAVDLTLSIPSLVPALAVGLTVCGIKCPRNVYLAITAAITIINFAALIGMIGVATVGALTTQIPLASGGVWQQLPTPLNPTPGVIYADAVLYPAFAAPAATTTTFTSTALNGSAVTAVNTAGSQLIPVINQQGQTVVLNTVLTGVPATATGVVLTRSPIVIPPSTSLNTLTAGRLGLAGAGQTLGAGPPLVSRELTPNMPTTALQLFEESCGPRCMILTRGQLLVSESDYAIGIERYFAGQGTYFEDLVKLEDTLAAFEIAATRSVLLDRITLPVLESSLPATLDASNPLLGGAVVQGSSTYVDADGSHFLVVYKVTNDRVFVFDSDPLGNVSKMKKEDILGGLPESWYSMSKSDFNQWWFKRAIVQVPR